MFLTNEVLKVFGIKFVIKVTWRLNLYFIKNFTTPIFILNSLKRNLVKYWSKIYKMTPDNLIRELTGEVEIDEREEVKVIERMIDKM